MQYYIDSLVKAISGVSDKLEIDYFDISEEELQQIIKASANLKSVSLNNCDIHCSKPLDFSSQNIYKICKLDLEFCGEESRKSDWMIDSSLFENIVEAIGKCGLKDSLKTVRIKNCKLKISKVQNMFKKHGMLDVCVKVGDKDIDEDDQNDQDDQ